MIEKQVTISYDEFEEMKIKLKMYEASKLCVLNVLYGYGLSGSHFSISAPEEFKDTMVELVNRCECNIKKPLEEKIEELLAIVDKKNTMIEDCQKFIEDRQKFIEDCQKDKLNKWWEFWK